VTGSPITAAGTLTLGKVSQSANLVYASPNGGAGVPTFRSLVAADIPTLAHSSLSGLTTGDDHTQYLRRQPTANWSVDASASYMGAIGGAAVAAQKLTIYTGADVNQGLVIKAFSPTQSAHLLNIVNSVGTSLTHVKANGSLRVRGDPSAILYGLGVGYTTSTDTAGEYGADLAITTTVARAFRICGFRGIAFAGHSSGTVDAVIGSQSEVWNTSIGTLTSAYGGRVQIVNASTGIISNAYGLYVIDAANAGGGTITSQVGLYIESQTKGTTTFALVTNAGHAVFNEGGDASTDFRVEGDADQNLLFTKASTDRVAIGTASPSTKFHSLLTDAGTAAVVNVLTVGHDSTGTPAAGFGAGLIFELESSTTAAQRAGRLTYEWVVATHASRTARAKWSVFDTAEREAMRIEASGTVPMIGFFGVNAVVRPTALTTALTTITHTAPSTPDYAIQDFVDVALGAGWAFANHDEANSVLKALANVQTRVGEMETKLQALGLLT
jgi:hypothetical protein